MWYYFSRDVNIKHFLAVWGIENIGNPCHMGKIRLRERKGMNTALTVSR